MEQFSIPGVGGIIEKDIDGIKHILVQARVKAETPHENGLIEIPAGKIRAFECIFDTLRREIKEETGLEVVEIMGENTSAVYESDPYKVVNFIPFSCSQNLIGDYPIMVFVFICKVRGELLSFSDESQDYRWVSLAEVKRMVEDAPQSLYPMHVDTLKKYIGVCG